jgi:hypothetical protein
MVDLCSLAGAGVLFGSLAGAGVLFGSLAGAGVLFRAAAAARRARVAAMPLIIAPMPAASVPSADTATHGSACGGELHTPVVHVPCESEAVVPKERITARTPSSAAMLQRTRARRFHTLAASA